MLNNLLINVLLMSFSGSVIAVALFAIMPVIKIKLTKSWQYYIWMVAILRAIIPLTPNNSLMSKLYGLLENNSQILNTTKDMEITGALGVIAD